MEGEGFLSAIEEEAKKIISFDPMDSSVLHTNGFDFSSSQDESPGDFDMLQDCTADVPEQDKAAVSDKVYLSGTKEFLEDDSWVEPSDHELGNDRSAPNVESSVHVPLISHPQLALRVSQIVKDDEEDVVNIDEVISGPFKSKNEVRSIPPVPPVQVTLQPSLQTVPIGIVPSNLGTKVVVEGTQISFVPEFANHFDLNDMNDEEVMEEVEFYDNEKEAKYKRFKMAQGEPSPPLQGPETTTQNAGGQGSGLTGHNVPPANASNNASLQQQHFNRGSTYRGSRR